MLKVFMILLGLVVSAYGKDYPISDHFDGKKFFNPTENSHHNFFDLIKWKITAEDSNWPELVANQTYPVIPLDETKRAVVTFINHATFLIKLKNLTVLTDPVFSERVSPFKFLGPKRVREAGMKLEELPLIDVVIISHNHYDHLDLESLKQIDGKFHPLFLVPLGNEKLLKEAGIQNVREMDWWEEQLIKEHKIVFTPSQHWSARGLFDRCETLWGSFYILSPQFKTYFGGDAGYSSHFSNIRLRLGAPDLSLLPIGAYAPRWFMKVHHMDPDEAVKAHRDLNSGFSIGMHFGTFKLSDESINEPIERLQGAKLDEFIVLDQGESRAF